MTKEEIRKYQELSIEVMLASVEEGREDGKVTPKVGAVLVSPDGKLIDTACRGELREGDHAEFTLLERKHRADRLDGCILFATLEPCAPGSRRHPKLGCAERITNARLAKVYIGVEDPDPTVCRKGIQHLMDKGVDVEMYPRDLQEIIIQANDQFLKQAKERAAQAEENSSEPIMLSKSEGNAPNSQFDDLDEGLLSDYMEKEGWKCEIGSILAKRLFTQLGIVNDLEGKTVPTGIGLLLFGKHPETLYPNAVIKATYIGPGKSEEIATFGGSILAQPEMAYEWYEKRIAKEIDRSKMERRNVYNYPLKAINEILKNAILHRDYDILGAPIYLTVTEDAIIVKSPGMPTPPITFEQIKKFDAPSLSRNPKIMHVFDVMGMAEQRGLGFKTVRELPEMDFPLPLVTIEEPYMVFTMPFNSKSKVMGSLQDLNEKELKGLEFIRMSENPIKRAQYEKVLNLEKKTAERQLKHLLELGLIEKLGQGPSTIYKSK